MTPRPLAIADQLRQDASALDSDVRTGTLSGWYQAMADRLREAADALDAAIARLERMEGSPAAPSGETPDQRWQFRKKPVVIQARQLGHDYDEDCAIMRWCGGFALRDDQVSEALELFRIATLEGDLIAREGDWIIKGVKGEFYPCKPDVFAATYEPVADTPSSSDTET